MRAWLAMLVGAAVVVAAAGCGGSSASMSETPAEPIEGGPPAATQPEPDRPAAATPATPVPDGDRYRQGFEAAVREGWTAPRRDRSMPPRIGVALVQLGPDGVVASWSWRRRSPDGPFNSHVEDFLNGLVGTRRVELPPSGTPTHSEVTNDGLAVQFADPDA